MPRKTRKGHQESTASELKESAPAQKKLVFFFPPRRTLAVDLCRQELIRIRHPYYLVPPSQREQKSRDRVQQQKCVAEQNAACPAPSQQSLTFTDGKSLPKVAAGEETGACSSSSSGSKGPVAAKGCDDGHQRCEGVDSEEEAASREKKLIDAHCKEIGCVRCESDGDGYVSHTPVPS